MDLPPVGHAASWIVVTGFVWLIFERAESVASIEGKRLVSRWLQNLHVANALPSTFAVIFDHVFGKRHWSWLCFRRSCLASYLSAMAIWLLWAETHPGAFSEILVDVKHEPQRAIPYYLFIIAAFNLLPDYLSLLKARWIIHLMSRRTVIWYVLLDLVISFLVGLVPWMLVDALISISNFSLREILPTLLLLRRNVTMAYGDFPVGVLFYSTFFTSVWVMLYALSAFALKGLRYFGVGLEGIKSLLNIQEKPIQSIGVVAVAIVTIGYMAAWPFVNR